MIRVLLIATAHGPRFIDAEIASTPAERAVGLMGRRAVPPGTGMLFVYDRPQEIGMWMANTIIPLDMVFLRQDGIVHRIAAWTVPGSLELVTSGGPAIAVLELGGGQAARMGIAPGDRALVL